MKKHRIISLVIAAALTAGMLTNGMIIKPVIAQAATASAIRDQLNAVSGLSASVSGNTVSVTGSASVPSSGNIVLYIDAGVTVNWNASLTGAATANNYVLTLAGGGAFNVLGGEIKNAATSAGGTVYISGGVTLNVSGGLIDSPGSGSAVTVSAGTMNAVINVSGGLISSVPNGYAINDGAGMAASSNNTVINVSTSGVVVAGSACAIRSTGIASVVTVSGGVVTNAAASNTNSTIYMTYAPPPAPGIDNIIITGGTVRTTNTGNQSYVVQSSQNVLITGGSVESIAGRAVNLVGLNSKAEITGGRVSTISGTAVSTATTTLDDITNTSVIISGGVVEATGTGTAVRITGYNSTLTVSGSAQVLAKSGLAIDASGRPLANSVTVSGGFVFAWGNGTDKVISPSAKLNLPVSGHVVAWNTSTGQRLDPPYIHDTETDLHSLPANSAKWADDPACDGIIAGTFMFANKDYADVNVEKDHFTLTIINGTSGGKTVLYVGAGATVTIEADPDEEPFYIRNSFLPGPGGGPPVFPPESGRVFSKWDTIQPGSGSFGVQNDRMTTFTMPSSDVTIIASYKPYYYFVIYSGGTIGKVEGQTHSVTSDYYPYASNTYGYFLEGTKIDIMSSSVSAQYGWNNGDVNFFLDDFINSAYPVHPKPGQNSLIFTMPGRMSFIGSAPTTTAYPGPKWTKHEITVINGIIIATTTGEPNGTDSGSYYAGTNLYLKADTPPTDEEEFDCWEVTPTTYNYWITANPAFDSIKNNPSIVFVTADDDDIIITAKYKTKTYSLTIDDGTSVIAKGSFASQYVVNISAPEIPGMVFSGWSSDSGGLFADPFARDTTFTMPNANTVITAHFEFIDAYTLTVINGYDESHRRFDPNDPPEEHHMGEVISVVANAPEAGMLFDKWEIDAGGGSFADMNSSSTLFTMPAADAVIRATYKTAQQQNTPPPSPPPSPPPIPNGTSEPHVQDPDAPGEPWDFSAQKPKTLPEQEPGDVSHILDTQIHKAYVVGVGDDYFAPEDYITRAQTAQMFYNLLLEQGYSAQGAEFTDVHPGAWYYDAVMTLAALGIISGYPDGTFRPDEPITRAEFVAMAVKFSNEQPGVYPAAHFADVPDTHWAKTAIETAAGYGWITGYGDNTFAPDIHMTRASAVTLVNKMLKRVPDKTFIRNNNRVKSYHDVSRSHWAYFEIAEASNTHDFMRLKDGIGEKWTQIQNH